MNKAALYVRLSKEDDNKLNSDDNSESVQNQIHLLSDYAIKNNMEIEGVYIDDDYSGLYEDRPEFKRLIENAKKNSFNVILCKTLSRFTRNVHHSEKYIEELFPQLGIRFVGIIDGIDTGIYENKKSRQINGLINDWYVEDLSNNIRAVFHRKMLDGENLAAFPTFGYLKDPNDKHKLIVDENAAEIVKYIFQLALEGYGIGRIADKLTDEKIPTPVQYKKGQGMRFSTPNNKYSKYGLWSTTTIKRMLKNETYVGYLIQGREKKVSYKSKKVITTPRKDWIIVKNHHEAIISEETFSAVQELLKNRRKSCNNTKDHIPMPHIFAGKVICMDCKNTMVKTSGKITNGYEYLICQLAKKTKYVECTRHSIRFDILEKKILMEIRNKIAECLQDQSNVKYIESHIERKNSSLFGIDKQTKMLLINSNEIKDKKNALANLYMDKVKGLITEHEYLEMKIVFQNAIEKLKDTNIKIQNTINEYYSQISNQDNNTILEDYRNLDKLTFDLVHEFISYIEIGEKKQEIIDGLLVEKQEILIHWNI